MPVIDLHHHISIPEAEAIAAEERKRRPQHADSFEGFFPPVSSEHNRKMTQENPSRISLSLSFVTVGKSVSD